MFPLFQCAPPKVGIAAGGALPSFIKKATMKLPQILTVNILLGFSFILLSCDSLIDILGSDGRDNNITKATEYAVYSAVLNSFKGEHSPYFVLSDTTGNYDISSNVHYLKENIPGLSNETIHSYGTRNKQKVKIVEIPNIEIKLDYLTKNSRDPWNRWKEVYPEADALIHLSRVGFNGRMDQALVYFTDFYAPLAGTGNIFYLEKEETWVVKKKIIAWIS